ncbi:MAG: endonuclease/exonuclease/phosphatase family protein [Candidatus Cloacimonadota bacterium]
MNLRIKLILMLLLLALLTACGTNTDLDNDPDDNDALLFGTENTLDIVTWNLREFPWQGQETLEALAQMIPRVKADIIALQEINDYSAFQTLSGMIPGYSTFVYSATSSYRLAFIYKTDAVDVDSVYTIYENQTNPFPRAPYVLKVNWRDNSYYVINNHLKAYGDNFIDEMDDWDDEVRRRLACQLLNQYISTELPDERVVVLGDMNDQIQEPVEYNVFTVFLDRPDEYRFATMPIALNPTFDTVSYPNSNSIIDHIMITNELYEGFGAAGSVCKAIQAEKWYGSWTNYTSQISDHRPVGIRLAY